MRHVTMRAVAAALALASLCASAADAPVHANNYTHPWREYGVAGFNFFEILTVTSRDGTDSATNLVYRATQTTDPAVAKAFIAYAAGAKSEYEKSAREPMKKICANRASLTTIATLGAAMDEVDAEVEELRAKLVRGSASVLGPTAMAEFEGFLSRQDGQRSASPTERWESRLNNGNRDPVETIDKICNAA